MRFEELEARAGKSAADIARGAEQAPFRLVLDRHRRRMAIAAWSASSAAAMLVLGTVLWWPGSASESSFAPVEVPTTTATTPTTTLGEREACPVTEPGDSPFTPAFETPDGPPATYDAAWFGTPELWTMVDHGGQVWDGLPVGVDGSLSQKTFWWSTSYDVGVESLPNITVTVEDLTGSEPTVEAGSPGTNGAHADLGSFMLVGIEIPAEGCWRITAEYRGMSLSYVAWASGR